MKLAVATLADAFIYDTDTREKTPIPQPGPGGRGAHGITWGGRFAFVGWTKPLEIVEYNEDWSLTGRKAQMWSNADSCDGPDVYVPQQMLHLNGLVLVANPARREISVFDFAQGLKRVDAWSPHEAEGAPQGDSPRRYNAILARSGLIHVLTQIEEDSYLYTFKRRGSLGDSEFVKATRCIGASCSIFPAGKGAGSCVHKSGKAQLVALTPKRKILTKAGNGCTLRGVALPEGFTVVGQSRAAKDGKTTGELLIWEGAGFRKKPKVHELGPGAVMDVRCLDMPDAVHGPNPVLGGE